jgi:hypothetical protein
MPLLFEPRIRWVFFNSLLEACRAIFVTAGTKNVIGPLLPPEYF